MDGYICIIPNDDEINEKWDYEINRATDDKNNWIFWKEEFVERYNNELAIPYYGILDGKIICEATASISKEVVSNYEGLVGEDTVYLSAFRTIEGYRGKGYFSRLFKFMLEDLKRRGYKYATVGVEPEEVTNKEIYKHFGFTDFIKSDKDVYPDGTVIEVEYYKKKL